MKEAEKRLKFFNDNSDVIQRLGDGRIVIYDKTYKDESSNLVLTPPERAEYDKLKNTQQPDLSEVVDWDVVDEIIRKYLKDVIYCGLHKRKTYQEIAKNATDEIKSYLHPQPKKKG